MESISIPLVLTPVESLLPLNQDFNTCKFAVCLAIVYRKSADLSETVTKKVTALIGKYILGYRTTLKCNCRCGLWNETCMMITVFVLPWLDHLFLIHPHTFDILLWPTHIVWNKLKYTTYGNFKVKLALKVYYQLNKSLSNHQYAGPQIQKAHSNQQSYGFIRILLLWE